MINDRRKVNAFGTASSAATPAVEGADKLVTTLERFELQAFGEAGDPFDPSLHEAVTHEESDDVEVPTASLIMRRGYRQGERVVRPAMVGVTAPSTPIVVPSAESSDSSSLDG